MGPLSGRHEHQKKKSKNGSKLRAYIQSSKTRRLEEKRQIETLEQAASQFVRRTFALIIYRC
jgi:hypothetical protein